MRRECAFHLAPDPIEARASASRLFEAFRREMAPSVPPGTEILHIGATAIAGCLTKGDLDIVVRVEEADFAAVRSLLAARYDRNEGSPETADFVAFEDGAAIPHLGIQVTVKGGAVDVFHLFADALNTDPHLVERYNDLKRRFSGAPTDVYRNAKAAFVQAVLQDARVA